MRSETLQGTARVLLRVMEAVPVWLSTLTIANSPSLAEAMRRLPATRGCRVEVIGLGSSHGVDVRRFSPSELTRPPRPTPVTVGFVGRICEDKGVETLLAACETLWDRGTEFRLAMFGEYESEPIRHRVETMTRAGRPLEWAGLCPPEQIYGRLSLLCLPSRREGFPNVVLEAAAAGVPAVVSSATGVRDSVLAGETGTIVDTDSAAQLADALDAMISDQTVLHEMGQRARSWVQQNFEESVVLDEFARRCSDHAIARSPELACTDIGGRESAS